ncbi:hypothetical protein KJ840_04740 [Patescibacteria group bacterium]|nr:hypothetical protein [Patescibacteria group bacterium]
MLETSQDLLYIVIAFCALWLTIFICWVIYYFAMILKRVYGVMETFTKTFEAVRDFFEKAKEKLEKTSSSLTLLLNLGKKIYDTVAEKQAAKTAKKKTK